MTVVLPPSADLADRYPRTVAAFSEMGALDHLERILRFDTVWDEIRRPTPARGRSEGADDRRASVAGPEIYARSNIGYSNGVKLKSKIDYDLIYAGGGLGKGGCPAHRRR